jgi:hypothetical protein
MADQLEERTRKWADTKYPDGDFAQYGDPIDELVDCLSAFARQIGREAMERSAAIADQLKSENAIRIARMIRKASADMYGEEK